MLFFSQKNKQKKYFLSSAKLTLTHTLHTLACIYLTEKKKITNYGDFVVSNTSRSF